MEGVEKSSAPCLSSGHSSKTAEEDFPGENQLPLSSSPFSFHLLIVILMGIFFVLF